jgi:hypothetical protein
MSSIVRFRDDRQHDGCPAVYVHRSGAVCVGSVPALDALEDLLRRSVRLREVSALGTLPACVARVNEQYGYARSFRLILDKGAQLPERPARELSTLLPSSPHPLANVPEVFQPYRPLRAFGKLDKLFADYVVGVASEPPFFARELLEAASYGVDCLSTADVAVRVYRYVLDSQVHADHTLGNKWLRVFDFARGKQIERAAPVREIGLPDAGLEQLHLPITGHKRDALPSLIGGNRPERYGTLFGIPREDAFIVGNGAVRFEPSLPALIQPVGICDFGEAPDYHLSRQPKAGLHSPVTESLKRVLPENPLLPRYFRDTVAGGVGALKRISQNARLLSRWTELQLGNELHTLK